MAASNRALDEMGLREPLLTLRGAQYTGLPIGQDRSCGTGDTNRKIVARRGTQVLFSISLSQYEDRCVKPGS